MNLKNIYKAEKEQYSSGARARYWNLGRDKNPYKKNTKAKHWWLAGWHDKDMELSTCV